MCGRIEVKNKKAVDLAVYRAHKVRFDCIQNQDLRPTQEVACLHFSHGQLSQANSHWGIKPNWAKHPLINAQSETVSSKKTFSSAWALHRCVVPCTGWFEWTGERGHKTKYRFANSNDRVLYMGGILIPDEDRDFSLVTLTMAADSQCSAYHRRMPLFVGSDKLVEWLSLPQDNPAAFTDSSELGLAVTQCH